MDAKSTMQPDRPAKARFTAKAQNARVGFYLSLWHKKDTRFICR